MIAYWCSEVSPYFVYQWNVSYPNREVFNLLANSDCMFVIKKFFITENYTFMSHSLIFIWFNLNWDRYKVSSARNWLSEDLDHHSLVVSSTLDHYGVVSSRFYPLVWPGQGVVVTCWKSYFSILPFGIRVVGCGLMFLCYFEGALGKKQYPRVFRGN